MHNRSDDTPIFPATDRIVVRLLKRPLSLLDAKRLWILRGFFLLTAACLFLLGFVQVTPATVVSLMMVLVFAMGSFASSLRRNRMRRIFLDGLRTARAGAAGLAIFHTIFAGIVVFTGPFGFGTSQYMLIKAACYVFLALPLYMLPLEPSKERPLQDSVEPISSPVVEHEEIRTELAALDRRKQELLDRKSELESHPDINRT